MKATLANDSCELASSPSCTLVREIWALRVVALGGEGGEGGGRGGGRGGGGRGRGREREGEGREGRGEGREGERGR